MAIANIDVERSVATIRDDNDKVVLTVTLSPLDEFDASPATRLIPAPGVNDEAALKQAAEVIVQFVNSDNFIHFDISDFVYNCASAPIHIVQFNVGNDPKKAFLNTVESLGVDPAYCKGALVNIEAPNNIGISEATSLVTNLSETLQPDASVMWGMMLNQQQKEIRLTVILSESEGKLSKA